MMRGDGWQKAYELSVDLAVDKLRATDLSACCDRSGATWQTEAGCADVEFLGSTYRVCPPDFEVVLAESGEPATIWEKILLLHYLETARGTTPTGKWVTFGEVPGGHIYMPVFAARSVDRILRAYAGNESALTEAARDVGGEPADTGDVSVVLRPLPRVPVMLILWRADEELPASGSLLFDSSVTDYLPMEDIVVLAGMVASRLSP